MKLMILGSLGKDVTIPEDPKIPIIDVWNDINDYCKTKATPDQCTALLGTGPLYLPFTCKAEIPFWAWMLVGFVASRITGI